MYTKMMPLYAIDTAGQLDPFLHREWLLTNGTGAFASSTLLGCNTRRYHSLLCATLTPPVGRYNMLSRVGEMISLPAENDTTWELGTNQFREHFHPRGYQHLQRFELDETARWLYRVDDMEIAKEFLLCWGRNVCGIQYTINPGKHRMRLELLPFLAMRDFHALRHGIDAQFQEHAWAGHTSITEHALQMLLSSDVAMWQSKPSWWYDHYYPIEAHRGMDHLEDLWNPGRFVFETDKPTSVTLWASSEPIDKPDWDTELELRRKSLAQAQGRLAVSGSDVGRRLTRSAVDFVVQRKTPTGEPGTSILAGFPWFADWGRDTMIALPGLLLSTGRFEQARQVLSVFAQYVSEGMIPNRFDDYDGPPHYNTADASLWFIHAVHEYLRLSGDRQTAEQKLLPACRQIIEGYSKGTRFGIHMDQTDGLIMQGDASTQLTWMDAKCDGITFTPRQGKAVEINALWYNALKLLGEEALADRVRQSFVKAFWVSPFRGLYDVINGDQKDGAIRPNQIFAVSLPHSPLDLDQQLAVVEVVRRELLTPYGLRTLAASDPRYCPRFEGSPCQRDGAYHNGTVWPWLIGPFLEAYLKTHDHSPAAIDQAKQWLQPLIAHLDDGACINQIAEVYDADPPHRPGGCCAQAWSVAEVLRMAVALGM